MKALNNVALSESEFSEIQKIMYDNTGIFLPHTKRALVLGRLSKRLRDNEIESFKSYIEYVKNPLNKTEWDLMINILTTNETYFFREKAHFDYLKTQALKNNKPGNVFRVWSAACSSGEEAYSIAMTLAEALPGVKPDISASDINTDMLSIAKKGVYPITRGTDIPDNYREKYCLKGVNSNDGKFAVSKRLKSYVKFYNINLLNPVPSIGRFDVVFLRNILIYFDSVSKRKVLQNIHAKMKKDSKLIMGHSESIIGFSDLFRKESASIYVREG